ncbi:MAG: hypothetical protein Q8N85_00085 [Candidatus Omnitrophota bacterium]|nr:hypothetical protein [Candidatus Omnitrophota bacterium]
MVIRRVPILLAAIFSFAFISAAGAEIKTDAEFNNFTSFYYLNPRPDQIPQALKYFIYSNLFRDGVKNNGQMIEAAAYFFGRTGQLDPYLLREYQRVFKASDELGKLFLISVFGVYRDKQVELFLQESQKDAPEGLQQKIAAVLAAPPLGRTSALQGVMRYQDLNFLWMEFFLTGQKEPISRIIDVMNWEDVLRVKVNLWLKQRRGKKEKEKFVELLRSDLRIGLDLDKQDFGFSTDLDCVYGTTELALRAQDKNMISYGEASGKKLGLNAEDKLYMATKGTAMWALYSNSKQHPRVLQYCREELAARDDKSKNELKIIVDFASPPVQNLKDSTNTVAGPV